MLYLTMNICEVLRITVYAEIDVERVHAKMGSCKVSQKSVGAITIM